MGSVIDLAQLVDEFNHLSATIAWTSKDGTTGTATITYDNGAAASPPPGTSPATAAAVKR